MDQTKPTPRKGALIGAGFFAQNHLNAWSELNGSEIIAICDLDIDKATAAAAQMNDVQVFTDAKLMLDTLNPDFIDIITTVESHRPLVELACRKDRLVICQKPFANTLADAQAMVNCAKQSDTKLLIHENFRWQKPFMKMHELLASGCIGEPRFSRFSFRHGYDNYKNQPYLMDTERFAIMDVGLHLFDLVRHFMGEVEHLSCHTQRLNQQVLGEDSFSSLLKHDNGAVSHIDVSFYSKYDPEPFPETIAVIEGDKGSIELSTGYQLIVHRPGKHQIIDVDTPVPPWGAKPWHVVQDSVRNLQQHALQVMNGAAQPEPSGEDNLKTLALALAAYESAEQNRMVSIS